MYLSEVTGHVFDSKRPTKSLYWDGQEKLLMASVNGMRH